MWIARYRLCSERARSRTSAPATEVGELAGAEVVVEVEVGRGVVVVVVVREVVVVVRGAVVVVTTLDHILA